MSSASSSGLPRFDSVEGGQRRARELADPGANVLDRRNVVCEAVIDHTRNVDLHHRPTQRLVVHLFAYRRRYEVGAGEKDGPIPFHDQCLVRHDRKVGAAGDTRTEDGGDLIDAFGRQPGIVVEDAPKVVAVWEDLVLHRQKDPGRIDQVDQR